MTCVGAPLHTNLRIILYLPLALERSQQDPKSAGLHAAGTHVPASIGRRTRVDYRVLLSDDLGEAVAAFFVTGTDIQVHLRTAGDTLALVVAHSVSSLELELPSIGV